MSLIEKKNSGVSGNTFKGDGSVTINYNELQPKIAFNAKSFIKILQTLDDHFTINKEYEEKKIERGMDEKNRLNKITETYYNEVILPNLEKNFNEIGMLLKHPSTKRFNKLHKRLGESLTDNYLAYEEKFTGGIAEHIQYIIDEMDDKYGDDILEHERDMTRVILHHLYFCCIYGRKVEDDNDYSTG